MVDLTRPFAIMATEVSVALYDEMARRLGRQLPRQPQWGRDPRHPVVNITWEDARDVCRGLGGRLPTEAEWEYAARGGLEGNVFPWGNEFNSSWANGRGTDDHDVWDWSSPVASFPPTGYGLYDVVGNVWEWVADWYGPYPAVRVRDPQGPPTGDRKVLRGGSWDSRWRRLRVSARQSRPPGGRYNLYVGMRCVKDEP